MPDAEVSAVYRRLAAQPGTVRLDGFHAVKHALRFGGDLRLALTADLAATLDLAARLAPDLCAAFAALATEVDAGTFAELAGRRPAPGDVTGLAARPTWQLPPPTGRTAPVVVVENPRNLGNYGAVVRVAAGFGACAVLSTGTVDPWHPTVLRGGAGLHFAEPVLRVDHDDLLGLGGPRIALAGGGADLRTTVIADDAVLLFGSERHGLSAELLRAADEVVTVPMRPKVSSYNLATTVAVVLYHWVAGKGPEYGIPAAELAPGRAAPPRPVDRADEVDGRVS